MNKQASMQFLQENLVSWKEDQTIESENHSFVEEILVVFAQLAAEERNYSANLHKHQFWAQLFQQEFNEQERSILQYYLPLRAHLKQPKMLEHCLRKAFHTPFDIKVEKRVFFQGGLENEPLEETILDHNTILGGMREITGSFYTINIIAASEGLLHQWLPNSQQRIFLEQFFFPLMLPQPSRFEIILKPAREFIHLSTAEKSSFLEVNLILA